jgi:GR25 family glycosyltransferase involved in LPS biosynthesis
MLATKSDLSESAIEFTQSYSKVFEGRELTYREIGCANSHNIARQMISENPLGGVILEDDARIIDIDEFFQISTRFLAMQFRNPSILSLTGFRLDKRANLSLLYKDCSFIFRLLGKSDLAVAYVLTQKASKILYNANVPINSVSDWPESRCVYHALIGPVVLHGDQNTKSLISIDESNFRKGVSFLDKVKLWTFYNFNIIKEVKVKAYLKVVFWNRIAWHFDYLGYMLVLRFYRFVCR